MPINPSIPVVTIVQTSSPDWLDWVRQQKSFRYEGHQTNFTCSRRPNGKWYGVKKIYSSDKPKPVALYIGADEDCTLATLSEIHSRFAMDWVDFWEWFHGDRQKKRSPSGSTSKADCTTDERVTQLEEKLKQVTADRDQLLIRLGNGKIQASEDAQTRIQQLEARVTELDNLNWELEKRYTTVEDINQKYLRQLTELKAQVEQLVVHENKCTTDAAALLNQLKPLLGKGHKVTLSKLEAFLEGSN